MRIQCAIGMQVQYPISRGSAVDCKIRAVGFELHAGRRGSEIEYMLLLLYEFLVYMAEHGSSHLFVSVQNRQQGLIIKQAEPVHPCAADGDRVMMQGHQAR